MIKGVFVCLYHTFSGQLLLFWYPKVMLFSSETIKGVNMIDHKIEKWAKIAIFGLAWSLLYIILGFEVTVVTALLFILLELRN